MRKEGTIVSEGERRLAAIMYTDIVGYTSLTQKDEALAMQLLEEHRRLVRSFFPKHNGREIKTVGDEFLVEFSSALEAVRCAYDIQQSMHEANSKRPDGSKVLLRIGIHLGDVIHRQNDIYGDAVNVASRIEPIAGPGGICVSQQVYDQVRNKLAHPFVSLGEKSLKNVSGTTEVYSVVMPWKETPSPQAPSEAAKSQRIAVLPFANMSPDPNDEYFADGMTEEVISTLSKVRDFEVISRTSVMLYKKNPKPVLEVSRELSAGTVLEGSVRKAGDRLRITVQMIDATKDLHLWADSYDRTLDDVFAVQSDIAKQVADVLRVKILSSEIERIEKKPTESTAAYTLYLKGRSLWNTRGLEDIKKALEYFQLAVHEDPDFALGYAGQADCFILLRDGWLIDREENLTKAKAMTEKALQLDPDLAEAHTTKGLILTGEYDLRHAEEEFRKAIEVKPSYATAHSRLAVWVLESELRWDEALKHLEKAVELDPLSPQVNNAHVSYYRYRKDFGQALKLSRRLTELTPSYPGGHWGLAFTYGRMKMYDEMEKELEVYERLVQSGYPRIRTYIDASTASLKDDKEAVRRILPELEAHPKETSAWAYGVACFHFFLGDVDKGFEWLEQAYSERDGLLLFIQMDRDLDGIRTDPRYLDLLKRLGLDQTPQTK